MKNPETSPFIILTGSPGTGKTSLLHELQRRGFQTFPEPARKVLADQRKRGGSALPEVDPAAFVDALLAESLLIFESAKSVTDVQFFDRGIPDTIAYAKWFKLPLEKFKQLSRSHSYQNRVFFLPPWEEIYKKDDERKMSFAEVKVFSDDLTEAYLELGYSLIEVPRTTLDLRADFVVDQIRKGRD